MRSNRCYLKLLTSTMAICFSVMTNAEDFKIAIDRIQLSDTYYECKEVPGTTISVAQGNLTQDGKWACDGHSTCTVVIKKMGEYPEAGEEYNWLYINERSAIRTCLRPYGTVEIRYKCLPDQTPKLKIGSLANENPVVASCP